MESSYSRKATFLLTLLSILGIAMVMGRYVLTGWLDRVMLIWNLFLAWMPLWIALYTRKLWRDKKIGNAVLAVCFVGWLLFFPNAPYIITDLIHLRETNETWLLFDTMMIFTMALTGLLTGLYSLLIVHKVARVVWGEFRAWAVVLGSLLLSGYGIYLGRVGRLNSWDVLANPFHLAEYVVQSAFNPAAMKITFVFSVVLIFTYAVFFLFSTDRQKGI
jgi:uncharacterized membrane protein